MRTRSDTAHPKAPIQCPSHTRRHARNLQAEHNCRDCFLLLQRPPAQAKQAQLSDAAGKRDPDQGVTAGTATQGSQQCALQVVSVPLSDWQHARCLASANHLWQQTMHSEHMGALSAPTWSWTPGKALVVLYVAAQGVLQKLGFICTAGHPPNDALGHLQKKSRGRQLTTSASPQ